MCERMYKHGNVCRDQRGTSVVFLGHSQYYIFLRSLIKPRAHPFLHPHWVIRDRLHSQVAGRVSLD